MNNMNTPDNAVEDLEIPDDVRSLEEIEAELETENKSN